MLNIWPRSDKFALVAVLISLFTLGKDIMLSRKTEAIKVELKNINAELAQFEKVKSKVAEIDKLKADIANIKNISTERIDFGGGASIGVE